MKPSAWWWQREPRERHALVAGGIILAGVAMYLLLEPVIGERARMRDALPGLRSDLIWMQSNVAELQAYLGMTGDGENRLSESFSLAEVQRIIGSRSMQDKVANLRPVSNNRIYIELHDVSFSGLADLLYALRVESGGRVMKAEITGVEGTPGRVRADLTLGQG